MNCILLSAFVGGCVDCKAMQGIKNNSIKFAKMYVALADRVIIFISQHFIIYEPNIVMKLPSPWNCEIKWVVEISKRV
jgi:hypothetical protein